MKSQKKRSEMKQQFVIAITLSLLFGLGWGIGLPATQNLQNTIEIRDTFASLFVLLTSFQGFFIFFMHCLRSADIRKQWKIWFKITTRQDYSETSTSGTSSSIRQKKRASVDTASTTAEKQSAKYKYIKKTSKKNLESTTSVGDEFSFTNENNDDAGGISTLQWNVDRYNKKTAAEPNNNFLPYIPEDEWENNNGYSDYGGSSDENAEFFEKQKHAATLPLPDGIIGQDFDDVSFDCISTTSRAKGNVTFHNPMEMKDMCFTENTILFNEDTVSVASEYDASQTVFINPMEDTV